MGDKYLFLLSQEIWQRLTSVERRLIIDRDPARGNWEAFFNAVNDLTDTGSVKRLAAKGLTHVKLYKTKGF